MRSMRFLLALVIVGLVSFPGVAVVDALQLGSAGHFGVLLIACLIGSLADRERFYGVEPR